jgi:TonB family protein
MLVSSALLLFALQIASADDKQQLAESLLASSQAIVNIRTSNTPSFRLRSNVRFLNPIRHLEVAYTEIWNSPDHWRREMTFPDFQQTEVGSKERRWILRDLETEPPEARLVRELFTVGIGLNTGKTKKVHNEEIQGVPARCVESRIGEMQQFLCFDAATGVLLLHRERSENRESSYEYSDYLKIGEKMYPRSLRHYHNGQKDIDAEVVELSPESSIDASIFVLPGATEWPVCDKVEPPKPLSTPDPNFPRGVKTNQAMSVLGVLVRQNGKPGGMRVVRSGGAGFDDAALQAVGQWTFRPALCNGTAIPAQVTVEIDFRR